MRQYNVPADIVNRICGNDDNEAAVERGPFEHMSAAMLMAWGLHSMNDRRIISWKEPILSALRGRYATHAAPTRKLILSHAPKLLDYLARVCVTWEQYTPQHGAAWCTAPTPDRHGIHRTPAPRSAQTRKWIVTQTMSTAVMLGIQIEVDRTPSPPAAAANPARPLTDEQADLVRSFADGGIAGSLRAVLVALSFAGASATEIASVTPADIDLDNSAVLLGLHKPRLHALDGWSRDAIARHLKARPNPPHPNQPLCVNPDLRHDRAAHSVSIRLGQVLADAGLAGTPGVAPTSIRLTALRRALGAAPDDGGDDG